MNGQDVLLAPRVAASRLDGTLALLLLLMGCGTAGEPAPDAPVVEPLLERLGESEAYEVIEPSVGIGGVTWAEVLTGGAASHQALPVVVAIHGLGSTGDSFARTMASYREPARVVVPNGSLPRNRGYSWFPYPPGRERIEVLDDGVVFGVESLVPVLEHLKARHGTPVVVTGFSQGGMMSFGLALGRPDLVCGAVPVAGYFPPDRVPASAEVDGVPIPPIVALHGDADTRLPLAPVQEVVGLLERAGVDAELALFPGVGHAYSPGMLDRAHAEIAEMAAACRP